MINEQWISDIEFTRDVCVKVDDQIDANTVFQYLHSKNEPLGYTDYAFRINEWGDTAYIRYYKGSKYWATSKTTDDYQVITFKQFKWFIWDEKFKPMFDQIGEMFENEK